MFQILTKACFVICPKGFFLEKNLPDLCSLDSPFSFSKYNMMHPFTFLSGILHKITSKSHYSFCN